MSETGQDETEQGSTAGDESPSEFGTEQATGPEDNSAVTPEDVDAAELVAEVELLREQNHRLRESYVQAKTTQYRRTAIGFAALGLTATLGAIILPTARTVLLALGATGLFTAVLTYYLTPERFVSADLGAHIYGTLASNHDTLASELGLEDVHIYVPIGEANTRVKLFIPHHQDCTIPEESALRSVFVVTGAPTERGVALTPTGNGLFGEFERALDGPLGETVPEILPQLREGLVEQFEIVDAVEFDRGQSGSPITVELENDVYGDVSRFDHPARSFIAVGLARGLDTPIQIADVDSDTGTISFRRLQR